MTLLTEIVQPPPSISVSKSKPSNQIFVDNLQYLTFRTSTAKREKPFSMCICVSMNYQSTMQFSI